MVVHYVEVNQIGTGLEQARTSSPSFCKVGGKIDGAIHGSSIAASLASGGDATLLQASTRVRKRSLRKRKASRLPY
jgi:hypothetical protein